MPLGRAPLVQGLPALRAAGIHATLVGEIDRDPNASVAESIAVMGGAIDAFEAPNELDNTAVSERRAGWRSCAPTCRRSRRRRAGRRRACRMRFLLVLPLVLPLVLLSLLVLLDTGVWLPVARARGCLWNGRRAHPVDFVADRLRRRRAVNVGDGV